MSDFDIQDEVFSAEEYNDAQKPYAVLDECEASVRVIAAGDEDRSTAVIKPNSIQVPLVLEATNDAGQTAKVWHNQVIAVKGSEDKKKKVRAMAARFYGAFGFSHEEAATIHRALLAREEGAAQALVDRVTKAHITKGQTNQGKDRNEVAYFYNNAA